MGKSFSLNIPVKISGEDLKNMEINVLHQASRA